MSPVIRISEPIYDKLQSIAAPFIDTPASVIERLIDFYEVNSDNKTFSPTFELQQNVHTQDILELNPDNPPNLTHTKIIEATFGDDDAYNWNDLVRIAHSIAKMKTGSFEELKRISTSRIINGYYTDRGYIYYKDIGMSIQSVNSNEAWKDTLNLAKKLNIHIKVIFQWLNNRGSSNPGIKGKFEWKPKLKER
ncbi:T4SS efffector SepA family protein [Candidatus Latescibacterota bacterium]